MKFGPPLRKVTEPYPDLVMHVSCRYTDGIQSMTTRGFDQRLCLAFPFCRPVMMTGVCLEMKEAHRKTFVSSFFSCLLNIVAFGC